MEPEDQRPPEESEPAPQAEPEPEPEARDEPLREWQLRLYLTIITIGLLVAYGIAFVLANNKHINLHFVVATTRVSLVWLILLSIALGMLLGVLLSQLYRRRRRRH
jgi:uncharacterized integral membrane protein